MSGYSTDLGARPVVFDYNRGAEYALGGAQKAAVGDDGQGAVCYERADFSVMPEQVQDGRFVPVESGFGNAHRAYLYLPSQPRNSAFHLPLWRVLAHGAHFGLYHLA